MNKINTDKVLEALENHEKKIKRNVRVVSVLMILTSMFLIGHSYLYDENWFQYTAKFLISILILFYVFLFKKQLSIVDVTQDVKSFIGKRIEKLEFQKRIRLLYMPIYIFLLFSLMTIYFYGFTGGGNVFENKIFLIITSLTLIYLLVVLYFGLKKEKKRIKNVIDPLIYDLKKISSSL